jgi:hypothetical protein
MLCLLSGIVCGLLAAKCLSLGAACQIGASQHGNGWSVWLHWINWVPGLVYGLLFAIANVGKTPVHRNRRMLLYGAVSGAIYLLAGLLFALARSVADSNNAGDLGAYIVVGIIILLAGSALTGLVAALGLAASANLLTRNRINFKGTDASPKAAALASSGALIIIGIIFLIVADRTDVASWAQPLALFVIWQVAVGVAISTSLQRSAAAQLSPGGS